MKVQPERPLSTSERERKHTINLAEHEKSSKAASMSIKQQQQLLDDEGEKKSSLTGVGGKDEFVVLEVGTVAPPNTPNDEDEQDAIDWEDEDADDCGKI